MKNGFNFTGCAKTSKNIRFYFKNTIFLSFDWDKIPQVLNSIYTFQYLFIVLFIYVFNFKLEAAKATHPHKRDMFTFSVGIHFSVLVFVRHWLGDEASWGQDLVWAKRMVMTGRSEFGRVGQKVGSCCTRQVTFLKPDILACWQPVDNGVASLLALLCKSLRCSAASTLSNSAILLDELTTFQSRTSKSLKPMQEITTINYSSSQNCRTLPWAHCLIFSTWLSYSFFIRQ